MVGCGAVGGGFRVRPGRVQRLILPTQSLHVAVVVTARTRGGLPTIYASPNQQNLKKVGLDQFLVTGSCELGLI